MNLQVGDRVEKISDNVDPHIQASTQGRVVKIWTEYVWGPGTRADVVWNGETRPLSYTINASNPDDFGNYGYRIFYPPTAAVVFKKLDYKNDWEDSLELI